MSKSPGNTSSDQGKSSLCTTEEFITHLGEARNNGFEFIPLVGAGLSAPSGVPIISEVHTYLQKCVAMALGLDLPEAWTPETTPQQEKTDVSTLRLHRFRRWLPGRDKWPPFGESPAYERDPVDWQERLAAAFTEMRSRCRQGEWDDYSELKLFQEAFGAAAEWRSLLLFLSRLRLRDSEQLPNDQRNKLVLGHPDLDIVDTFFLNVVQGKQPTLGHRMLAKLAKPLRFNLVLTTNFDNLLELAFDRVGNAFTVFDVHVETGLPSIRDMQGPNSLVKLHGGRYGLRADYSLDKPPNDDDLRRFVSYFANRPISVNEWRERKSPDRQFPARRHLLIVGMSASDERINLMIRAAAERLSNFKVFWVTFRESENEKVEKLLGTLFSDHKSPNSTRETGKNPPVSSQKPKDGEGPNYRITRHQFTGLLFLQAYQVLTKSIPSSEAIFPSPPQLPVPPHFEHINSLEIEKSLSKEDRKIKDSLSELEEKINDKIKECIASTDHVTGLSRTVLVMNKKAHFFGLSTATARVFDHQVDQGRQCVWIDLDEIPSCNDLFEVMVHAIARRAGIVDWLPVLRQRKETAPYRSQIEDAQIRELQRITNNPNRRWIIFLNARSGAGTSLEQSSNNDEHPNGWLDRSRSEQKRTDDQRPAVDRPDPTTNGEDFVDMLFRLTGDDCPNITVVLLCFDRSESAAKSGLLKTVENKLHKIPEPIQDETATISPDGNPLDEATIVEDAKAWIEKNSTEGDQSSRQRFLYAVCLANRTRYLSMLWAWPFHLEQHRSQERERISRKWINELEKIHVVRRKRGGFVWMHTGIRQRLRHQLGIRYKPTEAVIIHHGLAVWYQKLFLSSNDSSAVFEICHHRCQEVINLIKSCTNGGSKGQLNGSEASQRICDALSNAVRALELGRSDMLAVGFSKGVCRRLKYVRDDLLEEIEGELESVDAGKLQIDRIKHRIFRLRETSFRLNRAVAREVGENVIAFHRHLELRVLQYKFRSESGAIKKRRPSRKRKQPGQSFIYSTREQSFYGQLALLQPDVTEEQRRDEIKKILGPHTTEPASDWIESCNELGTLGIAVRSFACAERQLSKVFKRFGPEPDKKGNEHLFKLSEPLYLNNEDLASWLNNELPEKCKKYIDDFNVTKKTSGTTLKKCVLQVMMRITQSLQRRQQLYLAKGHALHTLARRTTESDDIYYMKAQGEFEKARRAFEMAIEMLDRINYEDVRLEMWNEKDVQFVPKDETHKYHDNCQHLLTQHGLCWAFLGDYEKAHRRLGEAEAALSRTRPDKTGIEQAIIDLHAAEVLTHQAMFRDRHDDKNNNSNLDMTTLGKFRNTITRSIRNDQSLSLAKLVKVGKEAIGNRNQNDVDRSASYIDDAMQTLARTDRVLAKNRKNVWWKSWYFQLNMKLIELQLFVSLYRRLSIYREEDESYGEAVLLPFLGLEQVARGAPTSLDKLLIDADRVVRLDLFRFTQIVESYSNCLLSLSLWRETLGSTPAESTLKKDTASRQENMCDQLIRAKQTLLHRRDQRHMLDEKWKSTTVDETISQYVEFVAGPTSIPNVPPKNHSHINQVHRIAIAGLWPHL